MGYERVRDLLEKDVPLNSIRWEVSFSGRRNRPGPVARYQPRPSPVPATTSSVPATTSLVPATMSPLPATSSLVRATSSLVRATSSLVRATSSSYPTTSSPVPCWRVNWYQPRRRWYQPQRRWYWPQRRWYRPLAWAVLATQSAGLTACRTRAAVRQYLDCKVVGVAPLEASMSRSFVARTLVKYARCSFVPVRPNKSEMAPAAAAQSAAAPRARCARHPKRPAPRQLREPADPGGHGPRVEESSVRSHGSLLSFGGGSSQSHDAAPPERDPEAASQGEAR